MKTILTIGYSKFALPASANVNAVIAALNKAQRVEEHYDKNRGYFYTPNQKDFEITFKLVDDESVRKTTVLKQIPLQAGPDAHNTFGS